VRPLENDHAAGLHAAAFLFPLLSFLGLFVAQRILGQITGQIVQGAGQAVLTVTDAANGEAARELLTAAIFAAGGGLCIGVGFTHFGLPIVLIGFGFFIVSAVLGIRGYRTVQRHNARTLAIEAAQRDRSAAIAEMAAAIGATLDYQTILEAAVNAGVMALREGIEHSRLVGMVLRKETDAKLHVAFSRRLTVHDQRFVVAGKAGVLYEAMQRAEPIIVNNGIDDPELGYYVAFQECNSILVIPLRVNYQPYGLLVYGSPEYNAFSRDHVALISAIGTQASIALQNAELFQNLREEKEKIITADEEARKKLARDLHDGPTQTVSAIAMRVSYARQMFDRDPSVVRTELDKIEEIARRMTDEIRHMLFTLRPLILETQGLAAALEQLRGKLRETHGLDLAVAVQPNLVELVPGHIQGTLFYIVEEALNNARKHAQARHHVVRLYRKDNYLVTEIEDDGAGFDVGAVMGGYSERNKMSLGMLNMHERAELIDSTLKIESALGRGTRITIVTPLPEQRPPNRPNNSGRNATARVS